MLASLLLLALELAVLPCGASFLEKEAAGMGHGQGPKECLNSKTRAVSNVKQLLLRHDRLPLPQRQPPHHPLLPADAVALGALVDSIAGDPELVGPLLLGQAHKA